MRSTGGIITKPILNHSKILLNTDRHEHMYLHILICILNIIDILLAPHGIFTIFEILAIHIYIFISEVEQKLK